VKNRAISWLKVSFLIGAIVDALALIPMLIPWAAGIFWGFDGFTGIYYYAMGMGASLMLAWTILLLWAYRQPLERRFVALFTIIIIVGIMVTEIIAVGQGYHQPAFSLGFQVVLIGLFGYSFVISGKK
jgi:hypothetical protein